MAFVVEDGTGIPGANSYASVEFADGYFEDRNVVKWAQASQVQKQAALIRATDYINSLPVAWAAEQTYAHQELKFPRGKGVTTLPTNLKRAVVLYALRALKADLLPDPVVDASGLRVTEITKKAEGVEKSVKYADPSSGSGGDLQLFRNYPEADTLLGALVAPTRTGRVIR